MSYLQIIDQKVEGRKTKVFYVWNTGNVQLGSIEFKPQWRKYVFQPLPNMAFDKDCLDEIANFLHSETVRWRNALAV